LEPLVEEGEIVIAGETILAERGRNVAEVDGRDLQ
jgi:hypothetical protein